MLVVCSARCCSSRPSQPPPAQLSPCAGIWPRPAAPDCLRAPFWRAPTATRAFARALGVAPSHPSRGRGDFFAPRAQTQNFSDNYIQPLGCANAADRLQCLRALSTEEFFAGTICLRVRLFFSLAGGPQETSMATPSWPLRCRGLPRSSSHRIASIVFPLVALNKAVSTKCQ